MYLYVIPFVLFIVITLSLYFVSNDEDKKSAKKIMKTSLPGIIVAISAFLFIKYKDNIFDDEPIMNGEYFE
jgi:FtsH-binding integral membrane protein